jgi:hypothetical protein
LGEGEKVKKKFSISKKMLQHSQDNTVPLSEKLYCFDCQKYHSKSKCIGTFLGIKLSDVELSVAELKRRINSLRKSNDLYRWSPDETANHIEEWIKQIFG